MGNKNRFSLAHISIILKTDILETI